MKDITKYIQIKSNNLKPVKGRVLISEPFMGDYYFGRSVILIAEHNEEGSFGVIVNKRIATGLNKVLKGFPDFNAPVFLGGPVETNNLFYIHTLGDQIEGAVEILDGLYWGGDIEALKELILIKKAEPRDIRFFVGYSGWSPNQLDEELKKNSWVVSNISKDFLIKTDAEKLWDNLLLKMGSHYKYWTKLPVDPSMN